MTTPEGTVTFWLQHEHRDWWSNGSGYNFGPISKGGLSLSAQKHPDCTLDITIAGAAGKSYSFNHPVPECGPKGLFVAFTWSPTEITLDLNGKLIETCPIE